MAKPNGKYLDQHSRPIPWEEVKQTVLVRIDVIFSGEQTELAIALCDLVLRPPVELLQIERMTDTTGKFVGKKVTETPTQKKHFAFFPFTAARGADEANQYTTMIREHVTCDACKRAMLLEMPNKVGWWWAVLRKPNAKPEIVFVIDLEGLAVVETMGWDVNSDLNEFFWIEAIAVPCPSDAPYQVS